jgi:O-acetyl-ADP-ribose deacetylase (regulator of RNase III)
MWRKLMKTIKGDLIKLAKEGAFDVIVHGCNCFCTMGHGIAAQIKRELHEACVADQHTQRGYKGKLGTFSVAKIIIEDRVLYVVNAYTQYDYGGNKMNVSYNALREVFKRIKEDFGDKRIGYPKIGAGLARGDWNKIYYIIEKELEGCDHTLVVL